MYMKSNKSQSFFILLLVQNGHMKSYKFEGYELQLKSNKSRSYFTLWSRVIFNRLKSQKTSKFGIRLHVYIESNAIYSFSLLGYCILSVNSLQMLQLQSTKDSTIYIENIYILCTICTHYIQYHSF